MGRKLNDGDFGSFNFDFGIELDVPKGASVGEFFEETYGNLHELLIDTLVKNNLIERPKD